MANVWMKIFHSIVGVCLCLFQLIILKFNRCVWQLICGNEFKFKNSLLNFGIVEFFSFLNEKVWFAPNSQFIHSGQCMKKAWFRFDWTIRMISWILYIWIIRLELLWEFVNPKFWTDLSIWMWIDHYFFLLIAKYDWPLASF